VAIYLGIDGGGTKTTCVVGDEQRVLGIARSGGSNIVRSGEEYARKNLQTAIKEACVEAGVSPTDVVRVCAGASGAGRVEIANVVRTAIAELVPSEVIVVGDTETTMYAAFEDGPGVIVIAGTGSIAFGRNASGEIFRAGGWGHAISDEGSGQWIGRTAVSEVFRARDENRPTELLDMIRQQWNVTDMDSFIRSANSVPPPNFADLLLTVLKAAEAGDEVAIRVLSRAGEELARLAALVIRHLFPKEESVALAMSGGVFRRAGSVRQTFREHVVKICPTAVIHTNVVDAAEGALALARKGIV
jgi:glucosamine kinase